jgi:hypothetical protein
MATLPIFGLGQALIDSADTSRRRTVFWLMIVYVASALGLLLTTCFLGIRRYLRQRNVKMPMAMAGVWLTSGGLLAVVLIVLGALLPRPNAEYRYVDIPQLGKEDTEASRVSPNKGDGGKGEGQPGEKTGENEKGKGTSAKDEPKDAGEKGGKGKKGKDGKDSKPKDAVTKSGETKDGESSDSTASETTWSFGELWQQVGTWLKWIAFAVVALIVVFALARGGLRYLANFTKWVRDLLDFFANFWARLFGGVVEEEKPASASGAAFGMQEEARAFAWYRNPWSDGTAGNRTLQDLMRYTFAALQAWAAERGVVREIGETPLEFAARIGDEAPALADDVERFIALYLRAEYAGGKLPAATREEVRHFWDRLEQATEQPLSA